MTAVLDPPALRAEPPVWRAAVTSFVPLRQRPRAERLVRGLPVISILLLQAALTLRLDNLANPDEALYIDAGHHYFTQWSGGPTAPAYGTYFSGFPYAYPLFAAMVDHVGGLFLVRFASLLMMMVATLCIRRVAEQLAGPAKARAAGLAAMLFFVCSAATLFVGHFATYDALCVCLTAIALRLAVTRTDSLSIILSGAAISAAAVVKYVGVAFVPIVLALAVLAAERVKAGVQRAILFAATALACLLDVFVSQRSFIETGIQFTTSNRATENYRSLSFLLQQLAAGAAVLIVMGLAGLVILWRAQRDLKRALMAVVLLAGGVLVPLSQLRIHEYTSFNKHVVFLALFWSPVAAQVTQLRVRVRRVPVLVTGIYTALVLALVHSSFMFSEWPNPSNVIHAVNAANKPGAYLGVGADAISYYEKKHPQFTWQEPYALYGAGPTAIRTAIREHTYEGIFYTSGSSSSAQLDASTALIAKLLAADPDYTLVGSWPKHRYDTDRYYLWIRSS